MIRATFLIFLWVVIAPLVNAETWISKYEQPVRLKKGSNCREIFKHDKKALCDCCLIKHGIVDGVALDKLVTSCKQIEQCTVAANEEAFSKNPFVAIADAKKRLRAMSIVRIDKLTNAQKLPKDGVLTKDHITHILKLLHSNGHLSLPSDFFIENNRLKIDPLNSSAKGCFSGQLFSIRYDPSSIGSATKTSTFEPLYILKETKRGVDEIGHLYHVAQSELAQERIPTFDRIRGLANSRPKTIADIAFDDAHFKIKTAGKTRYFSLLQTARGKSLHSILKEFGALAVAKDLDEQEFLDAFKGIRRIFYNVGYAISELHQKHNRDNKDTSKVGSTYTHGDLHSANIFYDTVTEKVTLIDNETFALSLPNPTSGVNDLLDFYMLHTVKTIAHYVSNQLTTNQEFGIDDKIWHDLWRALIDGYFTALNLATVDEFKREFNSFRQQFIDGFSDINPFVSLKSLKDQRRLKRLGPSKRRQQISRLQLPRLFDQIYIQQLAKHHASNN